MKFGMKFGEYRKAMMDKMAKQLDREAFKVYLVDQMLEIAEAYQETYPDGNQLHITVDLQGGTLMAYDGAVLGREHVFVCEKITEEDEEA